jgi:hypothetical protein
MCMGAAKRLNTGADVGSRTLDLRITSALLYQLSYVGTACKYSAKREPICVKN